LSREEPTNEKIKKGQEGKDKSQAAEVIQKAKVFEVIRDIRRTT